jgi:hypothetical protein
MFTINWLMYLHLVPRSRMRGAIPLLPQWAFLAWCLVKHRDNFTFYWIIETLNWLIDVYIATKNKNMQYEA